MAYTLSPAPTPAATNRHTRPSAPESASDALSRIMHAVDTLYPFGDHSALQSNARAHNRALPL